MNQNPTEIDTVQYLFESDSMDDYVSAYVGDSSTDKREHYHLMRINDRTSVCFHDGIVDSGAFLGDCEAAIKEFINVTIDFADSCSGNARHIEVHDTSSFDSLEEDFTNALPEDVDFHYR